MFVNACIVNVCKSMYMYANVCINLYVCTYIYMFKLYDIPIIIGKCMAPWWQWPVSVYHLYSSDEEWEFLWTLTYAPNMDVLHWQSSNKNKTANNKSWTIRTIRQVLQWGSIKGMKKKTRERKGVWQRHFAHRHCLKFIMSADHIKQLGHPVKNNMKHIIADHIHKLQS